MEAVNVSIVQINNSTILHFLLLGYAKVQLGFTFCLRRLQCRQWVKHGGQKKALEKEIKRWQRNLIAMDSISENRHVKRKLKGVQILERWISYGPWGRNRESASGSTFFSLEEGSNFVQNSRHKRTFFHFRRKSFLFVLPGHRLIFFSQLFFVPSRLYPLPAL